MFTTVFLAELAAMQQQLCKKLQQGFDFGVQLGKVGLADDAFNDAALLVYQKSGGCGADVAPGLGQLARVVQRHPKGQAALLRKIHDKTGRVVAHGYGHSVVAAPLVFFIGADDVWHFGHAGGAAGGPKIEQPDFAFKVCRGFATAI